MQESNSQKQTDIKAAKPERLLHRVNAAADVLDVSRSQVYNLINSGQLEVVRIGRSVRISNEALRRLASGKPAVEAR